MARRTIKKTASEAVRSLVAVTGKRFPAIKATASAQLRAMRARRYRSLARKTPVDPSAVVFESYEARNCSCSPRALYQAMLRDPRFEGVEKVWALRGPAVLALAQRGGYDVRGSDELDGGQGPEEDLETAMGTQALEELRRAVIVPRGTLEYSRAYARAALWVTNTVLSAQFVPRPGQTYLQTWHGTPLKRLGCDISEDTSGTAGLSVADIHRRYVAEGARLTWLLSPSRYTSEKLASAFDLTSSGREQAIIETGYPRNDFLHTFTSGDVERIKERLGVPSGKKVVLYAPTWREDQHSVGVGYTFENEVDFRALRTALGDDHVVLFRTHCLVSSRLDLSAHGGFVIDVSRVDDVNDLYVISDALVTDYSSVFFDYANLRRPTVFFMRDLERYAGQTRGLYLGLEDLPGPVVDTTEGLIDALRSGESPSEEDVERRERFRERFTYLDDGHASERVIERMLAEGAVRPTAADTGAGGGSKR
jgi:CDP-glycerol glycerophosphotransferase